MDAIIEQRRKQSLKLSVAIIVVALLGILVYSVITLMYRAGKVKIVVLYAPYASNVQIDGVHYDNNATHYIVPGKHHVKVELENFETLEEDYDLAGDSKIFGRLTAANDAGKEYAKQHASEFDGVYGLIGEQEVEYGQTIRDRYPLMSKLPVKDPHFAISYEITENNEFKVIIKASLAYRSMAITRMMEILSKDDIKNYDIEVKNLDSPFKSDFIANAETDPLKFLQAGYGSAMNGFTMGSSKEVNGYLYGFIRKNVGYVGEAYKFVLKRNKNSWTLCGKPYPVLSAKNTPNVPIDILYRADKSKY